MDCTLARSKRQRTRQNVDPRLDRYQAQFVPIDSITPSPENDAIYGSITRDDAMEQLIASIQRNGLSDPVVVTGDPERFVLSGHRRLFALRVLGETEVPITINSNVHRFGNAEFHRELVAHNPQRTKSVGTILREAMLRDISAADTYAAIEECRAAAMNVDAEFMEVAGTKVTIDISERRQEFLSAVQRVVQNLRKFWPLSIRQIHYRLLNVPPLMQTPKRSKFSAEHYRYRNDDTSYEALVRLLGPARYNGEIPMNCIDDPTRPQKTFGGFDSVAEFVNQEIERFLVGFHRDRQLDQPRHIEVFAEKNTVYRMVERPCARYYVPFSIGRGYCSIPVWRDIAKRFHASGKERMTLIIVSDYDPEGLSLADDAIRSLEKHDVPVDGHRIAVTREQIEEFGLANDFNPAKEDSTRFGSFVDRTGDTRTWECEALPPQYLVDQIEAAIEANMDMEVFKGICEEEKSGCEELFKIKQQIAGQLEF